MLNIFEEKRNKVMKFVVIQFFVLFLLFFLKNYNYNLFHVLAEGYGAAVALSIFLIVVNSKNHLNNNFLNLLSIGYLFIVLIDSVHILAYKGMNIFIGYDTNLPTQLWIFSRYFESITFLVSIIIFEKKLKKVVIYIIYSLISFAGVVAIFLRRFPVAYVDGSGLTMFKIASEYVIILIFAAGTFLLWKKKDKFDKTTFINLLFCFAFSIVSDFMFTFYVSPFDMFNLFGHYFKILSVYFVYKAVIQVAVKEPQKIIFRQLALKKEELEREVRDYVLELETISRSKTALIESMQEQIYVVDDKLVFRECYLHGDNFLNINSESIVNKHIDEIGLPHTALMVIKEAIEKTIENDKPQRVEYYLDSPKGRCWYDAQITAISRDKVLERKVLCIVRDITGRVIMEETIKQSEEKYRFLIENINDIIYILDIKGIFQFVSPVWTLNLGHSVSEVIGKSFASFIHPEDSHIVFEFLDKVKTTGLRQVGAEYRVRHVNGLWYWHTSSITPLMDELGHIIGFTGISRDITERKHMEEVIFNEKEQFKTTLLSVADGVIATDNSGKVLVMNKIAEKLTGWNQEEAIGKPLDQVFQVLKEFESNEPQYTLISKNGQETSIENSAAPIKDRNGEITGVVNVFKDNTEKKQRQKQVEYLSYHDPLTGLYNRRYMAEAIKNVDKEISLPITVMVLDVNGLKLTNDVFGHDVGDKVLKEAASAMTKVCGTGDIIFRVGGDEFVILLPNTNKSKAEEIKKRIIDAGSKTRPNNAIVSVAIGYSVKTSMEQDITEVQRNADNDMYKNKLKYGRTMRKLTLETVQKCINSKYDNESIHAERVAKYCEEIGRAMMLSEKEVEDIKVAGLLHDIGKIVISSELLNKPRRLSRNETETVKGHTEAGYRLLKGVDEYAALAEYVIYHHERWDGNGYPKGLAGEEIPLQARIIALAGSYETMTGKRAYKKSKSKAEAIDELLNCAGTQFDPKVVEVFVEKILKEDKKYNS